MLLELHVVDTDMSTGSIPVTWCLDKELIEAVKKWEDPHIVIVTSPDNNMISKRENRYVVPLKEMMTYVSFKHPGPNKIHAYIQMDKSRSILGKWCGEYSTSVVSNDEKAYTDRIISLYPYAKPLSVYVPGAFFAEEPAQWEKEWVLWLLKDKGIDQCAFRKRRIFAYTIQPLLMLLKLTMVFSISLIALLLGLRGFSMKYLFHPLTYSFGYVLDESVTNGTVFIRPKHKKWEYSDPKGFKEMLQYLLARCWSLPLMPPILAFIVFIILSGKLLIYLSTLGMILGVILFLHFLSSGTFSNIIFGISSKFAQIGGENELDELICTGEVKELPKKKSIRLRFLALKSQICKPFAG